MRKGKKTLGTPKTAAMNGPLTQEPHTQLWLGVAWLELNWTKSLKFLKYYNVVLGRKAWITRIITCIELIHRILILS